MFPPQLMTIFELEDFKSVMSIYYQFTYLHVSSTKLFLVDLTINLDHSEVFFYFTLRKRLWNYGFLFVTARSSASYFRLQPTIDNVARLNNYI